MKFPELPFSRLLPLRLPALTPFLGAGVYTGLRCVGGAWFRVAVPVGNRVEVTISFVNSQGDLDLYLYSPTGVEIHRSTTTSDSERVVSGSTGGVHSVNVRGYNGAQNTFSMKIDIRSVG
jgi:hypothetical protein